jgi:hypothetical protein
VWLAVALGAAVVLAPGARAGDGRSDSQSTLNDRRRDAIRRGADYIAAHQHPDGSFGQENAVVGITSLCVLALMADGSTDGRGRHGEAVRRGLDFLLNLVEKPHVRNPVDGYFVHKGDVNSRMHGQGYATLAVASALGTSTAARYRRLRGVLERAVACIEGAQHESGGFGYEPVPNQDHEGSVTVTVAQALRASRDAGLIIDENVVKRGLHYLKRSQKDDGSFRYHLSHERSSYALTAAALSSFFLYGQYQDDGTRVIQKGLAFLMGTDGLESMLRQPEWWYYGHFYGAWALWQKDGNEASSPTSYWARWHTRVYARYLDPSFPTGQRSDGSWSDEHDQFAFGPMLPTAFAVLTLAVPDETLPIFQR